MSITSDSLPLDRVNDFADTLLAQKLSEVTGVGLVTIEGNQKPAVRVQVNPAAISSLGLSLEDMRTILGQANVNAPKGSFDGPRQSFTIGSNDQIFSADAYKPIIVAYKNGAPIRLGDIANVIDSVENDQLGAWVGNRNGEQPAVLLDIQRQPGANIIQTVESVKATAAATDRHITAVGPCRSAGRSHRNDPRLRSATCNSHCFSRSRSSSW